MKFKRDTLALGETCPYCQGIVESTSQSQVDNASIWLDMVCVDCEKEWREYYTMTDIKPLVVIRGIES